MWGLADHVFITLFSHFPNPRRSLFLMAVIKTVESFSVQQRREEAVPVSIAQKKDMGLQKPVGWRWQRTANVSSAGTPLPRACFSVHVWIPIYTDLQLLPVVKNSTMAETALRQQSGQVTFHDLSFATYLSPIHSSKMKADQPVLQEGLSLPLSLFLLIIKKSK